MLISFLHSNPHSYFSQCPETEEMKKEFNEMTCFQSEDRTENFKCLDFLNKLQQEARNCFNREQHFDSENLKQFTYMRINLISIFWLISIYLKLNLNIYFIISYMYLNPFFEIEIIKLSQLCIIFPLLSLNFCWRLYFCYQLQMQETWENSHHNCLQSFQL